MDHHPNSLDRQSGSPAEKERVEKKQDESRELREASKEFVEGVAEVVEGSESNEVSESTGEDKKKGPQGTFPVKGGSKVQIHLQPLVIPGIEVMQIQIATAVHKEIAVLEKQAAKVSDNPFALSGVVGKIRELKYILANLTHVTFETLKSWWMRFVKKSS